MKKDNRRKNLEKELQRLNIGIVYQFGSTVQGISMLKSDVDLGIVFAGFRNPDNLLKIHDDLYILFSGIYPTREVDIVFLQTSHLTLQLNVINHGRVTYQISPVFRADYEEKVMLTYSDFAPFLREFDQMVLERIYI